MCPRIVAQVDNRRRDPAPYSLLVVRGCVVTSNGRPRVRRRTPVAPAAACTAAFAMGLSARLTRRRMEFTSRETWTLIHGLILGTFFLLAFAGGLAELWSLRTEDVTPAGISRRLRRLKIGTTAMAIAAWAAVVTGTGVLHPRHRGGL